MICINCILVINLIGDINILFFVKKPLLKRRFMSVKNIQKIMKDKEIDYVDLRFTDPRGKLQHVTMDAKVVDEPVTFSQVGLKSKQSDKSNSPVGSGSSGSTLVAV